MPEHSLPGSSRDERGRADLTEQDGDAEHSVSTHTKVAGSAEEALTTLPGSQPQGFIRRRVWVPPITGGQAHRHIGISDLEVPEVERHRIK